MSDRDYTAVFWVDQPAEKAFEAINNVRKWWSEEIEGDTDRVDQEWTYHYKDVHQCRMKITELIPGRKVEWLVLENDFNFASDKNEWKGTRIVFAISRRDIKTEVRFTHVGLSPKCECYNVCSHAWGFYINGSLRSLIVSGKGQPNPKDKEK